MALSYRALRDAATRFVATRALSERLGVQTAFLCHSHKDRDLAKGLVRLLEESGWQVYVDWDDPEMPPSPNRETAARIKRKIIDKLWFLFLATANSTGSRWCPWEIGYADGKKDIERIIVIPTTDDSGVSHGNEYLQLYRRLDVGDTRRLAVWAPGMTNGVFVESLR